MGTGPWEASFKGIGASQVVEKICLQVGQKDLRGEASTLTQPSGERKIDERKRT